MKTINGCAIIAHRPSTVWNDNGLAILAVKTFPDGTYEYVTAIVRTLDDREWNWGHYNTSLEAATSDYFSR